MKIRRLHGVVVAASVAALTVNPVLARVPADDPSPSITTGLAIMQGQTPTIVLNGQATVLGIHDPAAPLSINLSLPLRNQAALDDFIANQASRGIYMTNEQFDASFAPTQDQVAAVESWGTAHGLQTTYASQDGVTITLRGTTSAVAGALNVAIKDYRDPDGRTFFSNDRDASLPANLSVTSVSGLNNIVRFHTLHRAAQRAALNRAAMRGGGYYPSDFRTAYNLGGHNYDGTGQTIGFTLWGTSVANSDLASFASHTGDVAMSSGTGADQIEWIPTNGGSTATDALVETAMDVESAHGMATHAHMKYWLGDETCSGGSCGGSDVGLEAAISAAANDSSIHAVSNSWGGGEAPSTSDPFVSNTAASFQHAVAVGTTFYFSSGDSGSNSGGTGLASYPADSPYVVSVGGTTLNTTSTFAYSSESAWNGSGGGCSTVFTRPSWQTGVSRATCSGRAEPDIAADADPNSGAYVFVQGIGQQIGGTSLAAPLVTGMSAVADRYAASTSQTRIGWAAPKTYTLANGSSYSTAFHDVTSGNNGFAAGAGWDQATGWGSPNWWNWVQAIVGTAGGPTATPTSTPGGPTSTNTPIPTATSTTTGGNSCASDGTCLTGLSATASSVPVNTGVTLTATTNNDVGPTVWYIDIVNESGTIIKSCPSGSSCSISVTSSTAATHNYTAWLSSSSSSLTGGGPRSNTVGVTWTGSSATSTPSATRTNTPAPGATNTNTPVPPTATRTNTPIPPTATNTPTGGGGSGPSGNHSGSIATAGASDSYTFTPSASGSASIGTCATTTGNDYDLYVYNSAGTQLGSGTTSSYCDYATVSVTAGQTYTVKTLAYAGTGTYRSAWNVGGAQVVWNVSGSISTSGGNQILSFPTLSTGAITLSTCGPAGTDFDLYLLNASNSTLTSSTSTSNCESLSYTPSARGLFRLEEVAYSGTGNWSGTIKTF